MEKKNNTFIIVGKPRGKGRPRFSNKAKRVYTPQTTLDQEEYIKWSYIQQVPSKDRFLEGNIEVEILVEYPIPTKFNKEMKEDALNGKILPMQKPDVDNVAKIILDALNGIAYQDDASVCFLSVKKKFSEEPKTIVTVKN